MEYKSGGAARHGYPSSRSTTRLANGTSRTSGGSASIGPIGWCGGDVGIGRGERRSAVRSRVVAHEVHLDPRRPAFPFPQADSVDPDEPVRARRDHRHQGQEGKLLVDVEGQRDRARRAKRGLLSPVAATRPSASDLGLHLIAQRVDGAGLGHDLDTVGRDSAAGPERGLLDVRGTDHAGEMCAGRKRRRLAVRPRVPGRPERHAIRCRRGAPSRFDRCRRNGRGRGNRRILTVAASGGPSG